MLLAAVPSIMGAVGSVGAFASANAGLMGLASAGLGGASAVAGYMGERQQAAATDAAFKQNQINSLNAYSGDIEASNLDAMAGQENAANKRFNITKGGLAARSTASVGAGERGIGGLSRAALLADIGMQEGGEIANVNRNAELDQSRYRLSTEGARSGAQSRINSAPRGQKPSLLALGASLGSAALGGMQMTSSIKSAALLDAASKGPKV